MENSHLFLSLKSAFQFSDICFHVQYASQKGIVHKLFSGPQVDELFEQNC